jgi:hypothetical protein
LLSGVKHKNIKINHQFFSWNTVGLILLMCLLALSGKYVCRR